MSGTSRKFRASVFSVVMPLMVLGVLVAGLNLAASIPAEPAKERLVQGIATGQIQRQDFPTLTIAGVEILNVDAFDECLAFGHAVSTSKYPFSTRPTGVLSANDGSCAHFVESMLNPIGEELYARYFHGASAILRLTLPLLPLDALRAISLFGVLALSIVVTTLSWRNSRLLGFCVALFLFFVTVTPLQAISLVHGLSTSVGLAGIWVAYETVRKKPHWAFAVAASCGVVYAVISYLFAPMVYPLLLAVLVASLAIKDTRQVRRICTLTAVASTAWLIGYGFTMAMRFAWTYIVLGRDASLSEMHWAVISRSTSSALQPILNLGVSAQDFLGYPIQAISTGILLVILLVVAWKSRQGSLAGRDFTLLIIPNVYAAIWLAIFGGHNFHPWVIQVPLAMVLLGIAIGILRQRAGREMTAHEPGFIHTP